MYQLPIEVTTVCGTFPSNITLNVTVLCNGDVNGDQISDVQDALTLVQSFIGVNTIDSEYSAEVTGEGDLDVADLIMLINHGFFPETYTLR